MSKQIIDIGIAESSRVEIADGLSRLLADTYTLYIKTHYYHWNVTGPMFNSLHLMFENQYKSEFLIRLHRRGREFESLIVHQQ